MDPTIHQQSETKEDTLHAYSLPKEAMDTRPHFVQGQQGDNNENQQVELLNTNQPDALDPDWINLVETFCPVTTQVRHPLSGIRINETSDRVANQANELKWVEYEQGEFGLATSWPTDDSHSTEASSNAKQKEPMVDEIQKKNGNQFQLTQGEEDALPGTQNREAIIYITQNDLQAIMNQTFSTAPNSHQYEEGDTIDEQNYIYLSLEDNDGVFQKRKACSLQVAKELVMKKAKRALVEISINLSTQYFGKAYSKKRKPPPIAKEGRNQESPPKKPKESH
ncbi:uncharacterized protein G2W53_037276 [Senna tora]|uniref:Uncharacterized protein n=1 Tax=Senna tora TaxID=362788 RepID=A0A834SU30_9FABA|nr:uncharacterized protein G2W53_037276 [Senna tora]